MSALAFLSFFLREKSSDLPPPRNLLLPLCHPSPFPRLRQPFLFLGPLFFLCDPPFNKQPSSFFVSSPFPDNDAPRRYLRESPPPINPPPPPLNSPAILFFPSLVFGDGLTLVKKGLAGAGGASTSSKVFEKSLLGFPSRRCPDPSERFSRPPKSNGRPPLAGRLSSMDSVPPS